MATYNTGLHQLYAVHRQPWYQVLTRLLNGREVRVTILPRNGRRAGAEVANPRVDTITTIARRSPHALLPLEVILKVRDQPRVRLHRLRDEVPPRCVERVARAPGDVRPIDSARRVLEGVCRAEGDLVVERGEGVHVCEPGVGVEDVERVRVDFVHPEARVEVRERGDGGTDPGDGFCIRSGLVRAVIRVEYLPEIVWS